MAAFNVRARTVQIRQFFIFPARLSDNRVPVALRTVNLHYTHFRPRYDALCVFYNILAATFDKKDCENRETIEQNDQ